MKKIFFALLLFFSSTIMHFAYAGGGLTHMFIAQEAIALLPDAKLRTLLQNNMDAYLVGAYYPDSGYVDGNLYGEDSHWDPFIYAFADYIKETYPDPAAQNPKLVAFLFGCAAHRVSDEVIHWTFYNVVAEKDFNGDKGTAHSYADEGIDLLLNVDKYQWFTGPGSWWIPVSDLVAVYHRMGKDQYTADQINWGVSVISMAGFGERLISAPAYEYYRWKMPWTADHYYDWPEGGIQMDEQQVATYQADLWNRLLGTTSAKMAVKRGHSYPSESISNTTRLAEQALKNGTATVSVQKNADGSVVLGAPVIHKVSAFNDMLQTSIAKMSR